MWSWKLRGEGVERKKTGGVRGTGAFIQELSERSMHSESELSGR